MPKNLLVADDSLTMRKVIGMVFANQDFQITTVDNGLEAIAKGRELKPESPGGQVPESSRHPSDQRWSPGEPAADH